MNRIDIYQTIEQVEFPEEVWQWLDLFSDVIVTTQREAMYQEKLFVADTTFKKILLCTINKDLSTLSAIYILLRCELIHQASSHSRLLCESLITLKYISLDPELRADLFWGYLDIEAYEIYSSLLDWEKDRANPMHVKNLERFLESISTKYEEAKQNYTVTTRRGSKRSFYNWCNKSIANQARECGPELQRLYELVYKQRSSYIHGSAWSLRRQIAYSRAHYQPSVILIDIATIVRTSLVVWSEWAKFCISTLNWRLTDAIKEFHKRLEELDLKHFSNNS